MKSDLGKLIFFNCFFFFFFLLQMFSRSVVTYCVPFDQATSTYKQKARFDMKHIMKFILYFVIFVATKKL